jgi:hypothetical protein
MSHRQRKHRDMLQQIREQLGDTLFAEFMVESYSGPGEELSGALTRWLIDRLRSPPDGVNALANKTTRDEL